MGLAAMKPWEESWSTDIEGGEPIFDERYIPLSVYMSRPLNPNDPYGHKEMEARAKLAAQAPAMARLLIDVWNGHLIDEHSSDVTDILRAIGALGL